MSIIQTLSAEKLNFSTFQQALQERVAKVGRRQRRFRTGVKWSEISKLRYF